MKKEQEKKCFIITPIGNETDPIRRHIDGIIEAAIRPALGEKYDLVVAHKIYEPGSITKQIITEIYNAELVIANLTNRNPNVMYELAFRHSLGKPVIMIAEVGTNLPSDIIMERTIFYQNDAQGILDLKRDLEKAECEIDFSQINSPIYDVLHGIDRDKNIIQLSQNNTQTGQEALPYILEKLNKLEDMILANRFSSNTHSADFRKLAFKFPLSNLPEEDKVKDLFEELWDVVESIPQISMHKMRLNRDNKAIEIAFSAPSRLSLSDLIDLFSRAVDDAGIKSVGSPMPALMF